VDWKDYASENCEPPTCEEVVVTGERLPPLPLGAALENNQPLVLGFGFSAEFSNVNPWASGGGGIWGLNIQLLVGGPDAGLGLYLYTPDITPGGETASQGVNIGVGAGFNVTWGTGGWTGIFENTGVAYGEGVSVGLNSFASPGGTGWQGVGVGGSLGPLPGSAYSTNTDYKALGSSLFRLRSTFPMKQGVRASHR